MPDIVNMTSTHVVGVFTGNESRTALDNPNLNLNDPNIWNEVFGDGRTTDAGITVTKQKALECPPFWQAVQLISGDCGMLPLSPYRKKVKEDRTYWDEAPEHWTYSLCRVQANDDETSQDYFERLIADALVWSSGWGLIEWDVSMRPTALYHLLPDRTAWKWIDGAKYCVSEIGGRVRSFLPEDVIEIGGLKPLGGVLPDFVEQARNTIAAFLSANAFTSNFFKHGARSGGILELPLGMPKPVMQTIEEGFRKTYEGGDQAFKTVILRENAKFHAAQTSPRDVQAVETSERLARDVARWFGLPASMLNVEGTSSYNSKSQDSSGYVTHCLSRWLKKIQGQLRLRLIPARERGSIEFRHDTDELFTMDLQSRASAYQTLIAARVYNANDARIEEGMSPYEGGELYENPNTIAAVPVDVEEPVDEEAEPEEVEPDEPPMRSTLTLDNKRALISCTLSARHKSKKPGAFIDWTAKLDRSEPWQIDLAAAFSDLCDSTTATELPGRVEHVCLTYEKLYLGD